MSLAQLTALVEPPTRPIEPGSALEFSQVQEFLGLRLPRDYLEMIGAYGTGVFDGFLWSFNPGASNANLNLRVQAPRQASVLREVKGAAPSEVPFGIFPEVPGLLAWGITDNGDTLHWLTSADDARWRVVVAEARGPRFIEFALSTTDFLEGIFSRRIRCEIFPDDFPSAHPVFTPRQ